jgi:hypothetical protein
MKKVLITLVAIVVIIVAVSIFVAAYFGLIPSLSKFFLKQKDLGVSYDEALVEQVYADINFVTEFGDLTEPTTSDLIYTGANELTRDFTPEELSSMLSSWSDHYQYVPFKNMQVKIYDNGGVEISGILMIDRAVGLAKVLGYTNDQIDAAMKYADFLTNEIPFYGKGTGSAINNDVEISADSLQLGNLEIPDQYKDVVLNGVEDAIEKRIAQMTNLDAKKVTFDDSKLHFEGVVPAKVSVSK